jgi:hypothetical protein
MKRIPRIIYQTADEIDARVQQLEFDALDFQPDTNEHRRIMREIAKLRVYADVKRWLSASAKQHA